MSVFKHNFTTLSLSIFLLHVLHESIRYVSKYLSDSLQIFHPSHDSRHLVYQFTQSITSRLTTKTFSQTNFEFRLSNLTVITGILLNNFQYSNKKHKYTREVSRIGPEILNCLFSQFLVISLLLLFKLLPRYQRFL